MTMLPPFLPQSIRYGQNAFPDVEPFSIRAAASYEDIQYSIVTWIRDQLVPWIEENGAGTVWQSAAEALVADVNAALAAEAADFASRYGQFFQGAIVAPPPTGVWATDTANLQAAFATANARYADLILSPSTDGTIKKYSCSVPLVWNSNRGSLVGQGFVGIDFSPVPLSYQGAALTITTNTGNVPDGGHRSATHRVAGIYLYGHDSDTSLMDGLTIAEGAAGFGNDQGTIDAVQVLSFRDNLTFGVDVWDFEFHKCSFAKAHRYNINLSGGTGECQQFVNCDVYGATNAAGTAANVFSPAGQTVDVRFYGGSFDYPGGGGFGSSGSGGIQGIIKGGSIIFDSVHIEDGNSGPMFVYDNNTSGYGIDVTFVNCFTSSTGSVLRDHLHEIKASTKDNTTIRFQNDRGSTPNVSYWIADYSGLTTDAMSVTYEGFNASSNFGSAPAVTLLAPFGTLGKNTRFETANTFVTGGVLGWTAGNVGTWTIGTNNARNGSCLQLVGDGTTGTNNTYQRMRIASNRRPLRISGYQQVTAYTAGGVGLYARFYAEDGTTQIGTDYRIGTDLSAVSAWVGKTRRITPPNGAAFVQVFANGSNFQGTAQWDDIEVVPI